MCVPLAKPGGPREATEHLGWVQAPAGATHVRIGPVDGAAGDEWRRVDLRPVGERDACCHPLANVPRWSAYRPPFDVERIVLPASLEPLCEHLAGAAVCVRGAPASYAALRVLARRAALVLDREWILRLGLALPHIERLAAESLVFVDLSTFSLLLRAAGRDEMRSVAYQDAHDIMCARNEYAEFATRGLALLDTVPYCTRTPEGGFRLRVLKANRAWRAYADEHAFATLLSSRTSWMRHCGDVLTAARPIRSGELIATDLPWTVAGVHGPPTAPRLAAHLLRMHLGQPLSDWMQYWNRWDDLDVVIRDIADLPRRMTHLRTGRWRSPDDRLVHLALIAGPVGGTKAARSLDIYSGRIDQADVHDGIPPEAMAILVKMLARECGERTAWAERYLSDAEVVWRFESAGGKRYAPCYAAAAPGAIGEPTARLRLATAVAPPEDGAATVISPRLGILGDGSLEFQSELSSCVRAWIERALR
jgi:hypothetical protein